jgi:hypothetical protein
VGNATTDILGTKLLTDCKGKATGTPFCEPTWKGVEEAVPPIRKSGPSGAGGYWTTSCAGLRTFVGSRSASIDFSFDDVGEDCGWNGSPSVVSYAMGLHLKAMGETPQHWNTSAVADGLVGGVLPTALFYITVNSTDGPNPGPIGSRYWTYMNIPKPDMEGSREQGTWMRFQQVT